MLASLFEPFSLSLAAFLQLTPSLHQFLFSPFAAYQFLVQLQEPATNSTILALPSPQSLIDQPKKWPMASLECASITVWYPLAELRCMFI